MKNNVLIKLQDRLNYQWTLVNKAKTQDEVQQKRAEALETYRQLKKQKLQSGFVAIELSFALIAIIGVFYSLCGILSTTQTSLLMIIK